ncbi:acyltransferase [Thermomonas sp. XSG]|uniref:acyltransferase n=1 Tax=Thermomonas sp. XSG TaxID=2771436 RepID=UPI001680AB5D|nr:acyltransferase [Thermomonas sp. XSG]QNU16306.1 acyltransferase [Thermomonas sp. XSG]
MKILIDLLRWWKFRRVRLQVEGRGCEYKSLRSSFIAPQYLNLGDFVQIGPEAMIDATGGVEIGAGSILAPQVWIYSRTHHFGDAATALPFDNVVLTKKVTVGRYVWIAARATILPGVTIGDGAVVGAGAVVSRDVPPCAVVVGNPARVVRYRGVEQFRTLLESENPFVYERFGRKKVARKMTGSGRDASD